MQTNEQSQHSFPKRKKILITQLKPLIGKCVYCPALNNYIIITKKSILETAHHAAKNDFSIYAAKNLIKCIQNAKFTNWHFPKIGNQQSNFNFIIMYELHYNMPKIGDVKIMIGKNKKLFFIHYSITTK